MLWKDRRRSTNIIDIRQLLVAEITVAWGDRGNIIIDTDGSIYGSSDQFNLDIGVIPSGNLKEDDGWMPNMSSSQKESLRAVVQVATKNAIDHSVKQPTEIEDVILVQFVQSVINNR